jgi:hypothetical protein
LELIGLHHLQNQQLDACSYIPVIVQWGKEVVYQTHPGVR